jgi:RNA polymerase sigma-70 factor (ECF subfamily)
MARSGASEQARDRLQRMTPSLRRFARALVAGRARTTAADDLVQSALVGALHARDASDLALRTSLYASIVQLNRVRQAEPSQSVPAKAARPGIVAAIERLPLDQREALLLVVLEGFSYDQAAAILGLPRSSLVARIVRARQSLSGALVEETTHRGAHLRIVK